MSLPALLRIFIGIMSSVGLGLTIGSCIDNAPLSTTPSKDYPCGKSYVVCVSAGRQTGMCCDQNTACCDGSMCPAGKCEQIGGPDDGPPGKRRHALTEQFAPGTRP